MGERTTDDLLAQLVAPDPVGADLALFRTRVYRFTDDLRFYVLAEQLEENWIAGRPPEPATLDFVRACLDQIRRDGRLPAFDPSTPTWRATDLLTEVQRRDDLAVEPEGQGPPAVAAVIVGAPRSGTSHLFNLLARTQVFSYFTTVSCWRWPTWNLSRPGRVLFERLDWDAIEAVDNRATRLLPALVMPYESEDLLARAFPVYEHLGGHRYELGVTGRSNPAVLERSVADHLAYFNRPAFLCKSPFNSFRIRQLDRLWGESARYIHIVRSASDIAASLHRNRFRFFRGGLPLSGVEAADTFTNVVITTAPPERTLTVRFDDLQTAPTESIHRIMTWLAPECGHDGAKA